MPIECLFTVAYPLFYLKNSYSVYSTIAMFYHVTPMPGVEYKRCYTNVTSHYMALQILKIVPLSLYLEKGNLSGKSM